MSKPALGRGLGSLLEPEALSPSDPGDRGVQLLLRGRDGEVLVPPVEVEVPERDTLGIFPRWALAWAVVIDLLVLGVATWVAATGAGPGRLLVAGLLVSVGGTVLCGAVWLRGQPAVRELELLNPIAEEKPRLRVQFMDEVPRPKR